MSDLVTQLLAYQARVIRFASWPDRDGKNPEEVGWTISEAQTNALMVEAAHTIERLTAERDEARQQVARLLDVETGNRIAIANMTAERDALRLELWDLQRGFCNVASSLNKEITGSPRRPMQIARDNGWKCFEDEAYGPLED
jgi:hypothetical protein